MYLLLHIHIDQSASTFVLDKEYIQKMQTYQCKHALWFNSFESNPF